MTSVAPAAPAASLASSNAPGPSGPAMATLSPWAYGESNTGPHARHGCPLCKGLSAAGKKPVRLQGFPRSVVNGRQTLSARLATSLATKA